MSELLDYYRARATEYEAVYAKPERQPDLAHLHAAVPEWFINRQVLDVACGTGYWTRRIASRAATITGCDLARETLDLAIANSADKTAVRYVEGDAFLLQHVPGTFDAAFVGFFWSHIPRSGIMTFLAGLHKRLSDNGRVLILDNCYVPGSNSPITRTDSSGNTYQNRTLANSSVHEVLKNFPDASEVHETLTAAGAVNATVHLLPYFWYATYELARD